LRRLTPAAVALALAGVALLAAGPSGAPAAGRSATTTLFSRAAGGGTPNGASTHPVISADLRYSQLIAYESEASNLVSGDVNQVKDVFVVRRAGSFGDTGSAWNPGATQLVSSGIGGAPADGPSFSPSVDGNAKTRAKCVAFLSDADNLVAGDLNRQTDAFLAKAPDFTPTRVSLPGNAESVDDTTGVAVSGDCSRVAFVTGGKMYVRTGSSTRAITHGGAASDPAFDSGDTQSLVFAAAGGVHLLEPGATKSKLIAKGGRNPAYINRRQGGQQRRFVVYERKRGGHIQICMRAIGRGGERVLSSLHGKVGNRDSRNPSVFNRGINAGFESDATNLSIKSSGERGDKNGKTDAYFWSDTHDTTILESADSANNQFKAGGRNPSTSYYRNYIVFESSGNDVKAPAQIYLRYTGGI
jgi:hypothetical protein